jgi:hypothetical protein
MESMEEGFLAKILVPDGAKDIPVGEVIMSSKKNCLISLLGCFVVLFSMKGRFEEYMHGVYLLFHLKSISIKGLLMTKVVLLVYPRTLFMQRHV